MIGTGTSLITNGAKFHLGFEKPKPFFDWSLGNFVMRAHRLKRRQPWWILYTLKRNMEVPNKCFHCPKLALPS